LEEGIFSAVYAWLDLQRTSYDFGYGSLWSLARLVHHLVESSSFAAFSLTGSSASDVALVIIILTSGRGFIFALKWLPRALPDIVTRFLFSAVPGYGGAQDAIIFFP
jgi:uncharacterized membrane protein